MQFLRGRANGFVGRVILDALAGLARTLGEELPIAVGGKAAGIDFLMREEIAVALDGFLLPSVNDGQRGFHIAEDVINPVVVAGEGGRDPMEKPHGQLVVPAGIAVGRVPFAEFRDDPVMQNLKEDEQRHGEPFRGAVRDKQFGGQFPSVRLPAFGALRVHNEADERKVAHGGGVSAHFERVVEVVVFLVGFVIGFFQPLQLEPVASLFVDLGNENHPELQRAGQPVVLQHLTGDAQDIEVQNVRVPADSIQCAGITAEQVVVPQGEVARILHDGINPHGVIGDQERGLDAINEIQTGIVGKVFPDIQYLQAVVVGHGRCGATPKPMENL